MCPAASLPPSISEFCNVCRRRDSRFSAAKRHVCRKKKTRYRGEVRAINNHRRVRAKARCDRHSIGKSVPKRCRNRPMTLVGAEVFFPDVTQKFAVEEVSSFTTTIH